jgi:hypothetical protein
MAVMLKNGKVHLAAGKVAINPACYCFRERVSVLEADLGGVHVKLTVTAPCPRRGAKPPRADRTREAFD